ncbi:MAG: stage III sporulation protein AB [Lachnospiraceae bacterium]|nr:stage III sporulation protein AB [Lachnospiraceae bacterium]MBQ5806152.1 stage III sporulation protein AB [Lachnospiraceae bacterium]
MRLIGLMLMTVSLIGAGFVVAERGNMRLAILIQLRQMIHYLKSQILYSNATLPEAVIEVGNHFTDSEWEQVMRWKPACFFLNVGNVLSERGDQTFTDVWLAEVKRIPAEVPLTKNDCENLGSLGKNLGYADRNMQERTLLFYLEQLDETIGRVKTEAEHLGKLYRTLGAAAGMFWFILLI